MINFFDSNYITELSRNDDRFGLVDKGSLAQSTVDPNEKWIAEVINKKKKKVQFVSVDQNIRIYKNEKEQSLCDGMLYDEGKNWLAFVEMKEVIGNWMGKARSQLESTIEIFTKNHGVTSFRSRFAYAANRRHPHFQFSQKQVMQKFHDRYKFRLLFQNKIEVK